MLFFSGFSLQSEENFFSDFIDKSDFTVAGFSYGAQRAFDYVYGSSERIERLILLSPAFFQNEKRSFVRLQLRAHDQDKDAYLQHFLSNVAYPDKVDLFPYLKEGSGAELEALLSYRWERKKITELLARGTKIEIYLGGRDRIIDSEQAFSFFSALTTSYLLKDAGHLLQCQSRKVTD